MMQNVVLGRSGLKVSPICVGVWELGASRDAVDEVATTTAAIHLARELGVNCFDTAPDLGFGLSGQLLRAALDDELSEERDEVVIATEGGLRRDGDRLVRDASPEWLRKDVDASLRALGADVIDLYQVHWPDPNTPAGATADALAELVDAGKIRHAGVTVLDTGAQTLAFAEQDPLETLQTTYHMFRRDIEGLWLPHWRIHNLGVLIHGPLADGLLAGAMTPSSVFGGDDARSMVPAAVDESQAARGGARVRRPARGGTSRPLSSRPGYGFGRPHRPNPDREFQRKLATLDGLKHFAAAHEVSLPELGVAWTLANPAVDVALVSSSNPDHLRDTLGAVDVRLSPDDLTEIDRILRYPKSA